MFRIKNKRTEEGSNKSINDFCNDINKFDQQITNGKEDAINLWIEEKKNIFLKLLRRREEEEDFS